MKTIYLAGGAAEFEYRKETIAKYGEHFNFIDPIASSNELFERIGYDMRIERIFDRTKPRIVLPHWVREAIVKNDKAMILASDFVLAYIDHISFGTTMEINFSYHNHVPVFTVVTNEHMRNDVWLSVHSYSIFSSVDEAFEDIFTCCKGLFKND